MAQQQSSAMAQAVRESQKLEQELQSNPTSVQDKKTVVETAKKLLSILDIVQPEVNKAQNAFGGQTDNVNRINELRNKLNKVIAAYS